MRVRLQTPAAASSLAAAMELSGGTAHIVGETVELVHPAGGSAYEACELVFFVRAWATAAELGEHAGEALVEILG
jgi:hypothetical protein